jgi:hypothetical protein
MRVPGHFHTRASQRLRAADIPAASGRPDDRVGDGQPEPGSLAVIDRAVKPVEQPFPFFFGYAWPAVLDREADPARRRRYTDADAAG